MDIPNGKVGLRKQISNARPQPSTGLTANLVRLAMELNAQTIASYVPMASEPDVSDFNVWALALGKNLLLPRVVGDDLEFATGHTKAGAMGIQEPEGPSQLLGTADLILLPAMAIDLSGVRLGKGKGYYDRALRSIAGIPLYAVVFDSEVFRELPHEPHDRKVTGAVTPTAIHHIKASAFS